MQLTHRTKQIALKIIQVCKNKPPPYLSASTILPSLPHFFDSVTTGIIISSSDMPPCWNVSL